MTNLIMKIIIITSIFVTIVIADTKSVKNVKTIDHSVEKVVTGIEEARLRHHFLPFYGLLGFGGLHALAVLFAIKLKIVVIAAIIIGIVVFYLKVFAVKKFALAESAFAGAAAPIILDHPPSGYSSNIISSPDFGSYNGPDPYSAYADIHPDISFDSHHHHHHSDITFDHSPDISSFEDHRSAHHDGDEISAMMDGPSEPGPTSAQMLSGPTAPASSKPPKVIRRRIARQVNGVTNLFAGINLGELAFTFLGVDTVGCRRRFVCELDYRARFNPLIRISYKIIGQGFFEQYRDHNIPKPKSFIDCARTFKECAAAAPYDVNDDNDADDDDDDDKESNESSTNPEDVNVVSAITEASTNESTIDNAISEERKLSEPLGRLILKRF